MRFGCFGRQEVILKNSILLETRKISLFLDSKKFASVRKMRTKIEEA